MFQLVKNDLNIDFLKISKPFVWISTVAIVLSILGVFTKGLNYGIDFVGGAEIELKAPQGWDIGKLRSTLQTGGLKDAVVVQVGEPSKNEFLVRVRAGTEQLSSVSSQVENAVKNQPDSQGYEILKADMVGPEAGSQLRNAAFISILYAAIGILIYITMRFDTRFAPGIVRALLLDVVIVIGVWVLLGKEFDLNTIAALLTIAGYSTNDTIVIYDRIREFSALHPDWSLYKVVNRSINLNLGRTFITIGCTLFVVISLWLLGGPLLSDFAFAMMIGFGISAYSTIFVANPMIIYMENRRLHRLNKA